MATTQDDGDNMAIGSDGEPLPYSSSEVKEIVYKALDQGEVMAVVVRVKDDLMVQVMGPPSRELLDVLETTTKAYRRALEGH